MYPKTEAMLKKYFVDKCLIIKLTGESSDDYNVEFTIDMDDFYLKSSFVAHREDVEKWEG